MLRAFQRSWLPTKVVEAKTGIPRGTLHYYVDVLQEMGMLECKKISRLKFCRLTELGARVLATLSGSTRVF